MTDLKRVGCAPFMNTRIKNCYNWLPGWNYRVPITLTGGVSGYQTDFQLKLTLTHTADMRGDFGDVRFTQEDGTTLIAAWLESKVDNTSAEVWARFPSTPADGVNQTYYMYYGNAGVSGVWDGAATFQALFSDFNDLVGWTTREGTPVVSGGEVTLNTAAISRSVTFPDNYSVRMRAKYNTSNNTARFLLLDDTWLPNANSGAYVGWRVGDIMSYDGSWHDGGDYTTGNYDIVEMLNVDDTSHTFDLSVNDVVGVTGSGYRNALSMTTIGLLDTASGGYIVDWILVRKYTDNPPTHVFGDKEHY